MALPREDFEFRTLDGLTLRGWVFPTSQRGPAIIMSPGFNMPKDAILPDIAKSFQEHGVTCLLYDPRGIGASDGEPRNEIDARQQAEHLHDAITWFKEHPLVDEMKVALWGLCFGGNVTLAAVAFELTTPSTISKRISVQTYYKSLSWNVMDVVGYIAPTPVMMVTPELDVSCPAAEQIACYESMGEPKRLDILQGKGHLDWVFGDVESVLSRQLVFLKEYTGA